MYIWTKYLYIFGVTRFNNNNNNNKKEQEKRAPKRKVETKTCKKRDKKTVVIVVVTVIETRKSNNYIRISTERQTIFNCVECGPTWASCLVAPTLTMSRFRDQRVCCFGNVLYLTPMFLNTCRYIYIYVCMFEHEHVALEECS